jgi:hypothetical protein
MFCRNTRHKLVQLEVQPYIEIALSLKLLPIIMLVGKEKYYKEVG